MPCVQGKRRLCVGHGVSVAWEFKADGWVVKAVLHLWWFYGLRVAVMLVCAQCGGAAYQCESMPVARTSVRKMQVSRCKKDWGGAQWPTQLVCLEQLALVLLFILLSCGRLVGGVPNVTHVSHTALPTFCGAVEETHA